MNTLFLAAVLLGQVLMARGPNGQWVVQDPFGNQIDTSKSTSQGLQEAINYAHKHGYTLQVLGGTETGVYDTAQITATETIRIPAGAKGSYHFKGVSLWSLAGPWEDAIDIDCQDMLDFDFGGQIIYGGNYSAVGLFCATPFNEGYDQFTVFTSSRIRIMSIALVDNTTGIPQKQRGTGFSINPMNPFTFLTVDINEINGGAIPFVVYHGPGNMFGNTYNVRGVH